MTKWSSWAVAAAACGLITWPACGSDKPVPIKPDTPTPSTTLPDGGGGAGGGGEPASSIAGYVSGSRLRARYYQGADGSKAYIGLYDSQLSVQCNFARSVSEKACSKWSKLSKSLTLL
ncbi:MAG: hypothetical protein HY744_13305 [Deltaproteobacteria bacterium]|nr:hypothetical protein [Deltaproteobacteria bacterium]